jgi:beta-lactam-binding protein with PASTA domain
VNVVAANASWGCLSTAPGCGLSDTLQGAIERAGAAGVLVVAAAGNNGVDIDGTPFYPASQSCGSGGWDCIISVANIGSTGARFGNRGAASVDLGAPGDSILSTTPSAAYGTMSGTSMAAAYVSGAIGLCASLDPDVGPATLRNRVLGSGTPTSSLAGSTVTGTRLDVGALARQCGATVPDVVGVGAGMARDAIEAVDLDPVRDPDSFHASVPAGTVISQQPGSGRLRARGSPVHYVVSKGPAPVPVPIVVGLGSSAAASAITGAGLSPVRDPDAHSATVSVDTVISQAPTGGALPPGSDVHYVVSQGPIHVPSIIDTPSAAAASTLTSAGLVVGAVSQSIHPTVVAGNVISQDPVAGTPVGPGHAVSYVVSVGPAAVAVPDVVGLDAATATSVLAGAALDPVRGADEHSATAGAGLVARQDPVAGSLLAPGSRVTYTVSLGPPPAQPAPDAGTAPAPAEPGPAQPAPAQPSPGVVLVTVVVDDLSPSFKRRADGWRQATTGYQRHHYWVPARADVAHRVATWRPALAGPGTYRVVARIPSRDGMTRRATYRIQTADGWARTVLDQDAHRGDWISLGEHRLSATPLVKLTDRTGEQPSARRLVGFDAIRFVPLDGLAVASTGAVADPVATPATPSASPDPPADPTEAAVEEMAESTPGPTVGQSADPEELDAGSVGGAEGPTADERTEPTPEPKPPPEPEPTPEPKPGPGPQPEPRDEPNDEPRTDARPEPRARPEPAPERDPDPEAEPKPEPPPEPERPPELRPGPPPGSERSPEPTPVPTPQATPEPGPPAAAPGESPVPDMGQPA